MYLEVIENEPSVSTSTEISQFYDEIGWKQSQNTSQEEISKLLFENMKIHMTLKAYFLPAISGFVTSERQKVHINNKMAVWKYTWTL